MLGVAYPFRTVTPTFSLEPVFLTFNETVFDNLKSFDMTLLLPFFAAICYSFFLPDPVNDEIRCK